MDMLNPKEKQNALNEVRLMASILHQNIIEYKDSFIEEGVLYIVMEYMSGGDLRSKI